MASKSICLYFQVHQPTRLRLYRFFDIGKDSHYYDDFANRTIPAVSPRSAISR